MTGERVPGHAIEYEGRALWHAGYWCDYGHEPDHRSQHHGMCSCGVPGPPGLSQKKTQEWHREHKREVLEGRA